MRPVRTWAVCRMGTRPVAGPVQTHSTEDAPTANEAVADAARNKAEISAAVTWGRALTAHSNAVRRRGEKEAPSALLTVARTLAGRAESRAEQSASIRSG